MIFELSTAILDAMEVPIISRISDFEAGISRLQSPSFVSRVFGISGVHDASSLYSFWTWGALILAAVATLSGVVRRIMLPLHRLQKVNSAISQPLLYPNYDDDDESVTSCSSLSAEESESEDEDENIFSTQLEEKRHQEFGFAADCRVADSGKLLNGIKGKSFNLRRLSRRFLETTDDGGGENCLSGNVVKLWEGFGRGIETSDGCISLWDLHRNEKIRSLFVGVGQIPVLSTQSPAVLVSVGSGYPGGPAMKVWDSRIRAYNPAVVAEWEPLGSPSVGDLRKVTVRAAEQEDLTWFDADAVLIEGDGSPPPAQLGGWRGSVASRCREAVWSYLF